MQLLNNVNYQLLLFGGARPSLSLGFLLRVTSKFLYLQDLFIAERRGQRGGLSANEACFGRDDLFLATSAYTTLARTVYVHC